MGKESGHGLSGGGGGAGEPSERNKELGVERRTRLRGWTVRLCRLGFVW